MCEKENGATESRSALRLTGKQRAFIDAWFSNGFNGTRAAEEAGYSGGDGTPAEKDRQWSVQATVNLGKPRIQREIRRRWAARNGVTAEEVEAVLAAQMRAGVGDYIDKWGRIDLGLVQEKGASIVKSVTVDKGNRVSVVLESPQKAAELIGKSLGMFKDKVQHEGAITLVMDV